MKNFHILWHRVHASHMQAHEAPYLRVNELQLMLSCGTRSRNATAASERLCLLLLFPTRRGRLVVVTLVGFVVISALHGPGSAPLAALLAVLVAAVFLGDSARRASSFIAA